jgi:LDH2 family malate/lactate/ureidoglycolate dehydrogenase
VRSDGQSTTLLAPVEPLAQFCAAALGAAGADAPTVEGAVAAMMHGSVHGVDSHGVRLLEHYVKALQGGRVNPAPRLRTEETGLATATIDADNAHGALATYAGMKQAVDLAGRAGTGAVAIRNSSHFGPAGAFALAGADAGCLAMVTCNSDRVVRLHDGAEAFHGTNPLAFAAPVAGEPPWLLDMATSPIPFNRVGLWRSLGLPLPEGVASDAGGRDTTDPWAAEMLAPLGGPFGFKGAGIAGMVEILSAVLTGMRLSFEILSMSGPDFATPRGLGAFVLAIRPEAFGSPTSFSDGMRRYRDALRACPTRPDRRVMAPGDREWETATRRREVGIPIDPATADAFEQLAEAHGLKLPFPVSKRDTTQEGRNT